MNAMFKEIRHGDIEKIRMRIAKNLAVVNEVYTGTKPKKDIGQSPLQVAIKCGQFEIIDLQIENGADVDFMENPANKPEDTSASYFICMSVLHDAIIGAFGALPYGQFERAEKYVRVIETLLENGADPGKETTPHPISGNTALPFDTVIMQADSVLSRYWESNYEPDIKKYDAAKKHLFEILNLLVKYGADFDYWADISKCGDGTYRTVLIDDFVPKEDKPYEIEYRGKIIKGIRKGDVDHHKGIRMALQEYIKLNK